MIYVIKSREYLKVGYSQDEYSLNNRFKSYNTANPSYEILNVYEGDENNEYELHKLLKRVGTEWVSYNEDNLNIINSYVKNKNLKEIDLKTIEQKIIYYTLIFSSNFKLNVAIEKGRINRIEKEFTNNGIECKRINRTEYLKDPNKVLKCKENNIDNIEVNIKTTEVKDIYTNIKSVLLNKEYTFSELKDLFIPIFKTYNLSFNSSMLKLYFPEFTKCRKTREGKKDTYYKFNM